MSVVDPRLQPIVRSMLLTDLDRVMPIEQAAYRFPWTRGNFVDSLAAGHIAWALADARAIVAYLVALRGAQETHLLNLTVAPAHQHRGHAVALLDTLAEGARRRADAMLWLEVRESNQRARAVYQRYGFQPVGRRRGYYPASLGRREDAIVMNLELVRRADGLD